ncbi:MAG: NAD(+)/NADH kinase [Anaerovoracaceae bacterium]|jgi:NAD+ kinase
MNKAIFIYKNGNPPSLTTYELLKKKLDGSGFDVLDEYDRDAGLVICIGGDGTFLEAIHKYDFPQQPIMGINTGHLGFFEEISPNQIDDFIFNYKQGYYTLQPLNTVRLVVTANGTNEVIQALNEVIIREKDLHNVHVNLSIGGEFIERFSGDGLLIATSAGSTAHNYSLGGSIVDPRLNLLQVTPIAPMNTTAYRAFTSSILLPSDLPLGIQPDMGDNPCLKIFRDGVAVDYDHVTEMKVEISDTQIYLMRFEGYDFWTKVKDKFL